MRWCRWDVFPGIKEGTFAVQSIGSQAKSLTPSPVKAVSAAAKLGGKMDASIRPAAKRVAHDLLAQTFDLQGLEAAECASMLVMTCPLAKGPGLSNQWAQTFSQE